VTVTKGRTHETITTMTRPFLTAFLLALAACGGNNIASVHDLTSCGSGWGSAGAGVTCELACEEPLDETGPEMCYGVTTGHPYLPSESTPPEFCDHVATVQIDGVTTKGCCKGIDSAIRFAECCDGQRQSDGSIVFSCPK
jgi:hypothetical protein